MAILGNGVVCCCVAGVGSDIVLCLSVIFILKDMEEWKSIRKVRQGR